MAWREDGWPVMGSAPDGDGKGEPTLTHKMPNVSGAQPIAAPQTSDEFEGAKPGLQWQWNANPQPGWASLDARAGFLRLKSVPAPATRNDGKPAPDNLYDAPNFLLQKFPAPEFTVTTALEFSPGSEGETAGLAVFGFDYALLGLRRGAEGTRLTLIVNKGANKTGAGTEIASAEAKEGPVFLRVSVAKDATCRFAYSFDNGVYTPIGQPFKASVDRWMGAKVGLIATAKPGTNPTGHADFDWFRVTRFVP